MSVAPPEDGPVQVKKQEGIWNTRAACLKFTLCCSMLGLNRTHLQPLPQPNVALQGCTLARVASTVSSSEAFWRSLGRAHFTPEGGAHRLASLCVCVLHSLHSTVKDTQGKAQHGPIVDRPSTWLLLTLLQLQCIFLCPPFDASHVQLQSRLGNSSL